MQFTNPIGLLGLSGLIIPLAIHLLSRKEGKIIRIGSIRHLEETSTKHFKSIRLNEILLLILRCLLLVWIVFLISGLSLRGSSFEKTYWLLIEKGLEYNTDLKTLTDSLQKNGYELRALATDFPIVNDSILNSPDDYWGLIESLKERSLNNVVIISTNRADAFRGQRITLPENFTWISKPLSDHEAVISSILTSPDSVWIRKGKFSSDKTTFETFRSILSPEIKATAGDTLTIAFIQSPQFEYDSRIMLAVLDAVDKYVPYTIAITHFDEKDFTSSIKADWIFWLTASQPPEMKSAQFILRPQPGQRFLRHEKNKQWIISQRLNPDNVLRENLALSLTKILFPDDEAWKNAHANDVRTSDDRILSTEEVSTDHHEEAGVSNIDTIWIILIAVTLLAERLISYRRDQ